MEQLSIDERKVLNLYFDFFKHPDPTKKEISDHLNELVVQKFLTPEMKTDTMIDIIFSHTQANQWRETYCLQSL